ncbi:MAG: IMP dehydrogenase [Thermoproteota archaeon]
MVRLKDLGIEENYAFNFDDFILVPQYIDIEPSEISLQTKFTTNITLNVPFVSSPMDTVTEAEMAITLARNGGIGVIHRNCSIEEQIEQVKRVKRAESFIIRDVVVIHPEATVGEAAKQMQEHGISGLPVVDENNKLLGIITGRDVRFASPEIKVREAMTKDVIVANEKITPETSIELMKKYRIEKLPVVDENNRLVGLITYKDVSLRGKYKDAVRDEQGRLRVAAAVSPFDLDRAVKLSKFVDALVIDVSHFHNENVISSTKKIIEKVQCDVVIGNLGSKEGVLDSLSKLDKVAGLRVGIGSGSVCTTTQLTRAGSPTLYAVAKAREALDEIGMEIPIIADGGIRNAGDIAISIAFGASCAMMGYLFAGCKESPAPMMILGGRYYKLHRGMGSVSARQKRIAVDRYARLSKEIAEGTEAWLPYKGEATNVIQELAAGLRAAMGYAGARNIKELQTLAKVKRVSTTVFTKATDLLFPGETR